jgi:hypothetical protein
VLARYFYENRKGSWIIGRHLREHAAINLNPGSLEALDEAIVGQTVCS